MHELNSDRCSDARVFDFIWEIYDYLDNYELNMTDEDIARLPEKLCVIGHDAEIGQLFEYYKVCLLDRVIASFPHIN